MSPNNFFQTIKKIAVPPIFDDIEKSAQSRFLYAVIQSILVFVILAWIIAFIAFPSSDFIKIQFSFYVATITICLSLMWVVNQGYTSFAGTALSIGLWCIIAIGSYGNAGTAGSAYPVFYVVILVAGLLTSLRLSAILAFGGLIYGSFLIWLGQQNLLPAPLAPITPVNSFMSYIPGFLIVPLLIYFYQRNIRQLVERVRRSEAEKKAAEIYQIKNQELQQEIAERKRVETALMQAKNAAEVASEAKSEFLSSMSHELRTPLNGILGYAQVLARKQAFDPQETQQAAAIIEQSGQHLLTLINDILDLAKIEARKLELVPQQVDFSRFLQGIVSLIEMRAQEVGLKLAYRPKGELPLGIWADEKRLRQILINLLGNGVKFTRQGSVTLHVARLEIATPGQALLRFAIDDTGIGISPQDLERVFRPFEQGTTQGYQAQGTGLGLSISKQLVEAMGGVLHVTSKLGEGSCFWFDLLFTEVVPTAVLSTQPIIGYSGPRRKVLVADDIAYNRDLLVQLLQPLGFIVFTAANGHEAVALAEQEQPDIILMDLIMPEMSGWDATKAIRETAVGQHCLIIAISADAFEQQKDEAIRYGCNAFLAKPVAVESLLGMLATFGQIEWVHETAVSTQPASLSHGLLTPPPRDQLEQLYNLALSGNLLGIQTLIKEAQEQNGRFAPFFAHLNKLAENFEEEAIIAYLEKHLA